LNPVVKVAHHLLQNQFCYDFYQQAVGGVSYRNRFISTYLNKGELAVLDVGCGTGALLSDIPKSTKYFGIDISDEYLSAARQKRPDATFVNASVSENWSESLELGDKVLTTAMGLFHHLNDGEFRKLLSMLSNLLDSGSSIVSVDPVIIDTTSAIAKWFAKNDRGKFLRSPSEMESIFKSYGFELEMICKSNQFNIPLDTLEILAYKN
jgi:cyclopropane fatty-acyl-phospholipid synthase-like methyltransferase